MENMPKETQSAVDWSLQQELTDPFGQTRQVTKSTVGVLMTLVRRYFNEHDVKYTTYFWSDLKPYVEKSEYE